ncbi:alpha/beta hydrolase [Acaricomes phytoseiuli]|uniref:alpha/beta hydrolase family protein n=1 Tax=Acaricomes phytoseiuli TaxID=291968 RepID=UPI0003690A85|nr:alpha/beta fold hydrolase [Acaricomes phytoseiuli]MCW1250387.1 alpha/beta hydrolase [Acaricomes phytoseiuli]
MATNRRAPAERITAQQKQRRRQRALAWTLSGIAAGLGALSLAGVFSSALAGYFARRVVTPDQDLPDDLSILAIIRNGDEDWHIVLPATEDTTAPGRYGLSFSGGTGRARLGRVVSPTSTGEGTVTREVEKVYHGDLRNAVSGRLTGSILEHPTELDELVSSSENPPVGGQWREVMIETPAGPAPAWLIRAPAGQRIDTTAIIIHGRGARRNEGLRAVPVARRLGMDCLLISYRNDGDAPTADAGRYGLGLTEWQDVDPAIGYALSHGAKDVVVFGFSMGGAIALQLAERSRHRQRITALVLDSPVVNWIDVLNHQAALNRVPAVIGRYGRLMLSHSLGRRITGLSAPVDFQQMDWVSKAQQLRTPTLILHSKDDAYVPYGPPRDLAQKNPDIVSFVEFEQAGHVRAWNADSQRWEGEVAGWLTPLLGRYELPRRPAS